MYGSQASIPFSLELLHGSAEQADYDLFSKTHFFGDCTKGRVSQIGFVRKGTKWLKENIRKFDVFHGLQAFQMSVAPAWTARKLGVPAFVKVASWRADLAGSRFSRMAGIRGKRIRMLKDLSGVIAISSEIQQECIDCGVDPDKVFCIPNGVDVSHFQPRPVDGPGVTQRRESLGIRDLPTIFFAGGMVQRKRPHLLIQAIGILKERNRDVQLVLAGPEHDHQYVEQMKEMVQSLDLVEHVRFVGMQSDVRPWLHAADLFALPSMREGLPNAALEALACGVPTILTPMSGAKDLLEKQLPCGLICDPNEKDIAESLEALFSDGSLLEEFSKNAVQNMRNSFSSDSVLQRTLELFQNHV